MIPLIDLLIRKYIEDGLKRLEREPRKIREYFGYASESTIESMVKLITEYKINVLSGYPREPSKLPCIIIAIAGEQEGNYGLGDGIDENYPEMSIGEPNYLRWTNEEDSKYVQESIQLSASIRAEVWATDAVVTSFLYAITKYCILSAKWQMEEDGILIPMISGGDLEPAPDYFPEFVYRRAVIVDFDYIANYHIGNKVIGSEPDHMAKGTEKINLHIDGITEEELDGEKE